MGRSLKTATFVSLPTEHQLRMLAVKLLAGRAMLEGERKRNTENTHGTLDGNGMGTRGRSSPVSGNT